MSAILHGSEKALALKEKFMHEVSCLIPQSEYAS
jgi:hypothetical protein